jgi:aminocarboxymuconate-semialdehyde decarboxylase
MDAEVRLAAMDAAGIELQALSPNPITLFHAIEPQLAIPFARRHNELMAELVATHPDRFVGFAAVPIQHVEAAIAELDRAVHELGLVGPYIGTDLGRQLDDPALDAFYDAVVDFDVPLFVHPAPDGSDGGWRDDRQRRWDLDLVLGFSHDEALAALTLIYGGVLGRHPGLDVCISHGGGALGMTLGRARAAARRPWAPEWLSEEGAFDDLVRRLWFDVHVKNDTALELLRSFTDPERLVYGTNFGGWDAPREGEAKRPDGEFAAQLNANARRLLRLESS